MAELWTGNALASHADSWLVLAMCVAPCAHPLLRTLPHDLSATYARGHDDAPCNPNPDVHAARRPARLPARLGGHGRAERVARVAYWAACVGCAVLRLLRCLAKLGAGPALHAPLQLAFTLLTPDGRAGPLGALSTKACDRTNATCLSLESDRVAAGLISKLRAQERWGNLHRLQDLFTRCFS